MGRPVMVGRRRSSPEMVAADPPSPDEDAGPEVEVAAETEAIQAVYEDVLELARKPLL
jgi:hypothetical protein